MKGQFVGTDYNFEHSSSLRSLVFNNCLESNKEVYLKFKQHKVDHRVQRLLANGTTAQEDVEFD